MKKSYQMTGMLVVAPAGTAITHPPPPPSSSTTTTTTTTAITTQICMQGHVSL
jgi:hypothetical protein